MTPDRRPALRMADFLYDLPAHRIAARPLERRDSSRLLVYNSSTKALEHHVFHQIAALLPAGSLLVANRSRVVAARLLARKPTGGAAEVLLTRPISPSQDPAVVLASAEDSTWECLIGGKNVHQEMILESEEDRLSITVVSRNGTEGVVRLHSHSDTSLSETLQAIGHVPLPPYIKRDDDAEDHKRYQTVFAKVDGSVAAPTAGLHFTDAVLDSLASRNIETAEVTLHVGLGTFQPVEAEQAVDHIMHAERIEVDRSQLAHIARYCNNADAYVTVVGTTSMRTLESLYWFGQRILAGEQPNELSVGQWSAFNLAPVPRAEALSAVVTWMDGKGLTSAWGETRLMLAPGAHIGVADALITNFHQPGNTLLLLVAAFAGDPDWKEIYQQALAADYRFLSYGDSSLIMR